MKPGRIIKYAAIGLIAGAINGFFGSGGGTIVVPALVFLMGMEDHRAHATAIAVILPLTVVSSFFYIRENFLDVRLTAVVAMGGIVGGYLGARLLEHVPENVLRKVFGIFMIIAAVRMMLP